MRGQPPQTAARRALRGVISLALRVFFRRIDRVGVERVPARGPVMFVLNHPNALALLDASTLPGGRAGVAAS